MDAPLGYEFVPMEEHPTDLYRKELMNHPRTFLISINHTPVRVLIASSPIIAVNNKFLKTAASYVTPCTNDDCKKLPSFQTTTFDSCDEKCEQECNCEPIIYASLSLWIRNICSTLPIRIFLEPEHKGCYHLETAWKG